MEKILTIVIPTYNMQDYLRRCLDSLIVPEEQMKQLEVLVVNDGSKDNSSAIAHEYQDKYPDTFRVIDKENGNYGSCVNRGLKEATGKYIKILDADDWFDTNTLESYLKYLLLQNCDLVFNDCIKVNENGTEIGTFTIQHMKSNRTYNFSILITKNIFPQMHCVAYKVSKLREIRYFQTEGISYTDQEWVTKPMINIQTVSYFANFLYCYLIGREGQTMNLSVMNRMFDNQKKIAFSLASYSHLLSVDKEHIDYIRKKCYNFVQYLYYLHIVKGYFDKSDFIIFDSQLKKEYPKLYSYLKCNSVFIILWELHNTLGRVLLKLYSLIKR